MPYIDPRQDVNMIHNATSFKVMFICPKEYKAIYHGRTSFQEFPETLEGLATVNDLMNKFFHIRFKKSKYINIL
jgi:hypothetical protein